MDGAELSEIAKVIFEAPFCVLISNYDGEEGEEGEDIQCKYANKAALDLLGKKWEEVVGSPWTFGDEKTLKEASDQGVMEGVSFKMQASEGEEVELNDVLLVNVTSPDDERIGQAMIFDKWTLADGTEAGTGIVPAREIPSEEEVAAARELVDSLASYVRDLKENQGMTNDSDEVKEEVGKLLAAKEELASLEEKRKQLD